MNLDLQVDSDALRFVLVASVAVAFMLYTRFRIVAGGSVTGGFIAGLVLVGAWEVALWVIGLAFLSALVVRLGLLRMVPLSRAMVFQATVLTGMLLGVAIILIADPLAAGMDREAWALILAYGALVTPGLTGYDLIHQGVTKTLVGVGVVAAAALVLVVPLLAIADDLPTGYATLALDPARILILTPTEIWLGAIAAVLLGAALRLSFALRTGGFIGALFLAELQSWEALVTVSAGAVTTAIAVALLSRHVILTPRQKAQVALIGGALVAWAGLYWLTVAGWEPAMAANALTVGPLLAVGLIAADIGRPDGGLLRTAAGVAVATLLIVVLVEVSRTAGMAIAAVILVAMAIALAVPGARRTVAEWMQAVDTGRLIGLTVEPVEDEESVTKRR